MAPRMRPTLKSTLAALLVLASLPAAAEALPDPTRPAIGVEQGAVAAGSTAASPRLQLIKISSTRRSAIIDGQEVTLGSRIGEMRVVKITEGEVVLRGKDGSETLKLFAEVEKRPRATPDPGKDVGKAKPATPAKKKTDANASRKAQQ